MSDECRKCKTTEGVQKIEILGRLMVLCQKCFSEVARACQSQTDSTEHYFTTTTADKGKALDEAVAYGYTQPWEMSSVFWTHQNDAGHHCFTITYTPKLTQNSNTTIDGSMD